jgi:C4-type Zn-finger protein
MELTQEHFDQAIRALATQESVNELATRITTMEGVLNTHTTALQQLVSKKKTKENEDTVSLQRFKRLEDWAQKVGDKLGVKLEL